MPEEVNFAAKILEFLKKRLFQKHQIWLHFCVLNDSIIELNLKGIKIKWKLDRALFLNRNVNGRCTFC